MSLAFSVLLCSTVSIVCSMNKPLQADRRQIFLTASVTTMYSLENKCNTCTLYTVYRHDYNYDVRVHGVHIIRAITIAVVLIVRIFTLRPPCYGVIVLYVVLSIVGRNR